MAAVAEHERAPLIAPGAEVSDSCAPSDTCAPSDSCVAAPHPAACNMMRRGSFRHGVGKGGVVMSTGQAVRFMGRHYEHRRRMAANAAYAAYVGSRPSVSPYDLSSQGMAIFMAAIMAPLAVYLACMAKLHWLATTVLGLVAPFAMCAALWPVVKEPIPVLAVNPPRWAAWAKAWQKRALQKGRDGTLRPRRVQPRSGPTKEMHDSAEKVQAVFRGRQARKAYKKTRKKSTSRRAADVDEESFIARGAKKSLSVGRRVIERLGAFASAVSERGHACQHWLALKVAMIFKAVPSMAHAVPMFLELMMGFTALRDFDHLLHNPPRQAAKFGLLFFCSSVQLTDTIAWMWSSFTKRIPFLNQETSALSTAASAMGNLAGQLGAIVRPCYDTLQRTLTEAIADIVDAAIRRSVLTKIDKDGDGQHEHHEHHEHHKHHKHHKHHGHHGQSSSSEEDTTSNSEGESPGSGRPHIVHSTADRGGSKFCAALRRMVRRVRRLPRAALETEVVQQSVKRFGEVFREYGTMVRNSPIKSIAAVLILAIMLDKFVPKVRLALAHVSRRISQVQWMRGLRMGDGGRAGGLGVREWTALGGSQ